MNKHSYKVGDRVILTKEMELVIKTRLEVHPEHDALIVKGPHTVRSITCCNGCRVTSYASRLIKKFTN